MPHVHLHCLHQHRAILTSHSCPPITAVTHSYSFPIWSPKSTAPIPLRKTTTTSSRPPTTRCMANPRRVKMVAKQIQRELSDMLLTDKVLQYAILPEAALGADRYLSSLTTISDVEVSGDLQVKTRYLHMCNDTVLVNEIGKWHKNAVVLTMQSGQQVVKVYVSVFGDERGREVAISGLKSKAKYVRSELGKRIKLRLTPEIRFIEDESMEKGSRVIAILDKIKAEKKTVEIPEDEVSDSSSLSRDDRDWDGDDPDGKIIYVN